MKLSCVLMAWALSVCPAVLLATQMLLATAGCHAAASSETLKCEGPVSTEQSGCHTDEEEDVIHASEEDFQVKGYKFSKPFHLIVSYDWLILQGPDTSIFEGDPLVLHCRAWQDWPLTQVIFYQEGSALAPPGPKREFSIDVVQKSDSGHYHCSGVFRSPGPGSRETASPVAITVQELFPAPVLKALPSSEPQEGDSVTLSCQTKLSLQRSASRLLFSFYKDGRSLSIRGISAELQIPKASEEHSGSYWCEAATEDRQVWKQSPQLEIRVQGPLNSVDSSILNPALQKPTASETPPMEPPGPLRPPPAPSAEHLRVSSSDPHLLHQIQMLLKQMQDVKVLLGHLVVELRELTVYLKPGITKVADK
ncbi:Fc receptor-like A isoform X1 [Cricetulus griseus]|uniref:Fc receptor-like A isoform X1 n=1 Tax=Cricetulus griseus TaxID=10029 RepID=A0A9J7K6F1_CRIGR|nr:Fc receptor-like A isoform X1 [Cricetulus griseus]XP_035314597.1 Fc receptor-like A isoform X1 [Cricetulus griseus]